MQRYRLSAIKNDFIWQKLFCVCEIYIHMYIGTYRYINIVRRTNSHNIIIFLNSFLQRSKTIFFNVFQLEFTLGSQTINQTNRGDPETTTCRIVEEYTLFITYFNMSLEAINIFNKNEQKTSSFRPLVKFSK